MRKNQAKRSLFITSMKTIHTQASYLPLLTIDLKMSVVFWFKKQLLQRNLPRRSFTSFCNNVVQTKVSACRLTNTLFGYIFEIFMLVNTLTQMNFLTSGFETTASLRLEDNTSVWKIAGQGGCVSSSSVSWRHQSLTFLSQKIHAASIAAY